MSLPPTKLANWPHADLAIAWEPVRGGFSGAAIYRGSIDGILHFALKGWPLHVSGERIRELHRYQLALCSFPYIPKLELTHLGESAVIADGRIWELSHWMPGEPNRESPFPNAKRKAAVVALQSIHGVWKERFGTSLAPCPAVLRRLALIDDFQRWHGSNASRSVDPILATAMTRVPDELTDVSRRLHPWAAQRVPVQVCFTDIHRDHVLFTGDRVTGVIDFGAAKVDSPATDLARLFGEEPTSLIAAEAEYGDVPVGLAGTLAATAPACNLAAWILRIERDRELLADREAVARRIAGWVDRLG